MDHMKLLAWVIAQCCGTSSELSGLPCLKPIGSIDKLPSSSLFGRGGYSHLSCRQASLLRPGRCISSHHGIHTRQARGHGHKTNTHEIFRKISNMSQSTKSPLVLGDNGLLNTHTHTHNMLIDPKKRMLKCVKINVLLLQVKRYH